MRRPEFIARQSRCPTGVLGSLLARIMARETAAENAKVLEILNLIPTDYVLEIGFGHGHTIAKTAAAANSGFVAGIDISEQMVRKAARDNRELLASGRLELTRGDGETLPYADCHFDKAYSVHTIYFWPRPQKVLKEIHRVTKKGGMLVLGSKADSEDSRKEFPASVYRFFSSDELQRLVEQAGFDGIDIGEFAFHGRRMLLLSARRPL